MFGFVGRILEWLIGIVLAVFVPILLVGIKTDQIVQANAQEVVEEFVTKSAATGQIDQASYMEFITKLDATGTVYDVQFTHEHLVYEPTVNTSGAAATPNYEDGFVSYYYATGTDEILGTIYGGSEDRPYYMSYGDSFYVTAVNKTPTLGSRMLTLIHLSGEDNKIIAKYSAFVSRVNEKVN